MPVLSLAGCYTECRYKWLIRLLIHRYAIASLDWIGKSAPVPLLNINRTEVRSFTFSDGTHTQSHPAGNGPTLKRKKEKSGHKGGAKGQNNAEGRGTDGPPKPTYTEEGA